MGEEKFESSALEIYRVKEQVGRAARGGSGGGRTGPQPGTVAPRRQQASPAWLSPELRARWRQTAGISSREAAVFMDGEVLTFPVI